MTPAGKTKIIYEEKMKMKKEKRFEKISLRMGAASGILAAALLTGCGMIAQKEKAPSLSDILAEYSVEVPSELSSDLNSMQVVIDGELYQMPFSYADIKDKYWIDMDTYQGRKSLPGGSKVTTMGASGVALHSDEISEDAHFTVEFCNTSNEEKQIEDCEIYEVNMDIEYTRGGKFPELILPGGITWGSSLEDVKAAYGESTIERASDGVTTLRYDNEVHLFSIIVSDRLGVVSISYSME